MSTWFIMKFFLLFLGGVIAEITVSVVGAGQGQLQNGASVLQAAQSQPLPIPAAPPSSNKILPVPNGGHGAVVPNVQSHGYPTNSTCNGNFDLKSQTDIYKIGHCKTINGSISVAPGFNQQQLDLGQLEEITGDFSIENNGDIDGIDALWLKKIGGLFKLSKLTSVTKVEMALLSQVGRVEWQVLPMLLKVTSRLLSGMDSVVIADTALTEVDLSAMPKKVSEVNVNNNNYLTKLELPMEEVTRRLLVADNGRKLMVSLPKLAKAKNITMHNVGVVDLSFLEKVDDSMAFIDNNFTKLDLLKVTKVGGTLHIANNPQLEVIKLNKLEEVSGGLVAVNLTKITEVKAFSNVKTIGGALEIEGPIESVNFDGLTELKGLAILKSTSQNFSCDKWLQSAMVEKIRGGLIRCELESGKYVSLDAGETRHLIQESEANPKLAKPAQNVGVRTAISQMAFLVVLFAAI